MATEPIISEQVTDIKKRFLVGSVFLTHGAVLGIEDGIFVILDLYLTKTSDRQLFGLPPLSNGDC